MVMKTLFAPLLAVSLLAGCVTPGVATADPVGTQWTFVSIDGQAPVSPKTSLTIEPNRVGANVGCNGMGSALTIENGRLVTSHVISTMMFCEGLMDQERAVAALLEAKPAFFIEGDRLTIHSDAHKAELVRAK